MKNHHHIVKNFPKNAPLWKKILSNVVFQIGVTKITSRKNLLTPKDYRAVKKMLRRGDVILVGQHKRVIKYLIPGPVTHVALCTSHCRFVHATVDGVEKITLKEIINEYDTLIVLRPRTDKDGKKVIQNSIKYAKKQIGKPFNFFFTDDTDIFFCTQLVHNAYHQAGFETGFSNYVKPQQNIVNKLIKIKTPLQPVDFVKGNFDQLYLSNNLNIDPVGNIKFVQPK
jgi:hypothetical protein